MNFHLGTDYKRMYNWGWSSAGLFGVGLWLSGCGYSVSPEPSPFPTASATTDDTLIIVTPHRREIQEEFERAFKAKYPSVSLRWESKAGTGDALRYVQQQFAPKTFSTARTQSIQRPPKKSSRADIFFGGGPESFLELEDEGLLQTLPSDYGVPPELNGVPLRSYNNRWVAAALSRFGILYNKTLATRQHLPLPATWADLGNPALRGHLELADPRRSGSARVIYESILQLYGWDKGWQVLTAMAGNTSAFVNLSSTPLKDVTQGRAIFAPTVNFLAQSALESSSLPTSSFKLGYIEPKGQQVITPDPIGILKGAPHPDLARKFVDFVLSAQGQNLWMFKKGSAGGPQKTNLYRLSVLPSHYQPLAAQSLVRLDPYAQFKVQPYNSQKAAIRHKVLEDLIGVLLIENHTLLAQRWKCQPDAVRQTFVPVTEQQVKNLAAQWGNPKFRASMMVLWRQALVRRFAKEARGGATSPLS
ncbi:phosphoglycerate transport regulatory protein PgtC [Abditibacteriota bacterium]|nr:phosphoglycerate transport regulatory protein PgtC [Abditibacteriota bacterium]